MDKGNIGGKSLSLLKLKEAGFNVPTFMAVSAADVQTFVLKDGSFDEKVLVRVIDRARTEIVCDRYVVRSSALIEDTKENSYAGQFKTKVNLSADEIYDAVKEIVTHAFEFLKGDISKFSFLVQEYIEADYSGVLFTRNPLGGREAVIEYHCGIGEDLVSGQIKPKKKEFYWTQPDVKLSLPNFRENVFVFKKIEDLFKFPQDIEWCIRDGEWYFLQSRPITTVIQKQYDEYLFLDSALPKGEKFIYEKTEISEIAGRPTPFTYSLLELIYGGNGPVDKIYGKFGVKYLSKPFLKIVGDELYVDRELEIKTLLPSYSYFGKGDFKLRFQTFTGLWITIWNFFCLNKINLKIYSELKNSLSESLNVKLDESLSFSDRLNYFLEKYALIFEVNLLADKALKSLSQALKGQKISVAEIFNSKEDEEDVLIFDGRNLKGNCLEINDETVFDNSHLKLSKNEAVEKWYKSLSGLRQKFIFPLIQQAQKYSNLREYGRWLTVKNVNYLRDSLNDKIEYFATVSELVAGKVPKKVCDERRMKYEKYLNYEFPGTLVSSPVIFEKGEQGVSAGVVTGKLVLEGSISGKVDEILYTKILSPYLTRYFGQIRGIVSEKGGLLSHLAIMARENKIPVIVGFNLNNSCVKLGDKIKIDGSVGEIEKI